MTIQPVDPQTLNRWLNNGEAILVDVREPAEYASEHIKDSTLVPLATVRRDALPDRAGRKLVIHCRKGMRGQSACEKLREQLPDVDIYNLAGGIEAWMAAGLPVESTGRRLLPLDRQVQLTIGLLLVVGSVLGSLYGTGFFWLTGLIGTGLTFAGLTGFCGLARLLAIMPWNRG